MDQPTSTPVQAPAPSPEPAPFQANLDPKLRMSADPAADMAAGLAAKAVSMMMGGPAPAPVPPPVAPPVPPAPVPPPVPPAPVPPPVPPPPAPPPAPPAPAPAPPAQPLPPVSLADRYAVPDPSAQPVVPTLPEVPAQEEIRLPENTAENVGHAFAAARAETKKFRELAEKYRQEVEKVRSDYANYAQRENAITEKLTAAENRARDLEDQIGKLDLERSPAFREKYDMPINQKKAALADELAASGVPQADAESLAASIITAQDSQAVQDLVSTLSPQAQGIAFIRFNEADKLFAEREAAINEWRQTEAGLAQVSTRENIVADAQRRNELSTKGLERVAAIVPPSLWTDPDFAQYRDGMTEKVKAWYGQASEDQIAAAAIEGALVAPYAYQVIEQMGNVILDLQGKLDAKKRLGAPSVSPYFRSEPPPPPPPAKPKEESEEGNKPWSTADVGDPVAAAASMVHKILVPPAAR